MVAIFGLIGGNNLSDVAAIGSRLGHHGNEEVIWSPTPQVSLGWRLPSSAGGISSPPSIPLAFAGSILNRQELADLIGRASDGDSHDADAKLLWEVYLKFGVDGFAEINGQFALALLS